jgi:hypothetical protein
MSIVQTRVEGRPATVAYLTPDLEPSDAAHAQIVKVMFQDGDREVIFASRQLDKPDRP